MKASEMIIHLYDGSCSSRGACCIALDLLFDEERVKQEFFAKPAMDSPAHTLEFLRVDLIPTLRKLSYASFEWEDEW